ncbi:membrane protein [Reticulibacter mediterranei]|uniref:Membrane protein n=1 Tax=Reticulibacter mediterranei TaxID=2778369 RepID=A0A8J3IF00_9CHLR|nr:FTR1 family protein [Reticulibacter mediterranei]GHO91310.1 membrane protein [Reticulibacter mediterranei]
MIAAFILFLREGLEASLIVGILMAVLRQLGQTKHMLAVWMGVFLAVLASIALGVILYLTAGAMQQFLLVFKAITFVVAVIILTWMTFWMQQHSRTMKKEMLEKASTATSGFALGLLAFSTVGREGVETVIFSLAFIFQSDGFSFIIGGLAGTLAAVILGVLVYGGGYRLNYRIFFRVMGLLLIVLSAGLLSNAIESLQGLGWLPFTPALWSTSDILSELDGPGYILHTFLGYSDNPTILQVGGYVIYLLVAGVLFWRQTRRPEPRPSAHPSSETIQQSEATQKA